MHHGVGETEAGAQQAQAQLHKQLEADCNMAFVIAGDLQQVCKPLCFSLVSQTTTEAERAFDRAQVWPGPALAEHERGLQEGVFMIMIPLNAECIPVLLRSTQ